MARRESPLDPSAGPLHQFAHDLRSLRHKTGLTYRELAEKAGYSRTTLSDAASGKTLPSMDVVRAYVAVCGGDQVEWTRRWHEVNSALSAERARPAAEPASADAYLSELLAAVRQYWVDAELHHRVEATGWLPVRLVEADEPAVPVPATILEIFQRSAQLLVLGPPGVGKSVLLLELTRQLAEAWAADPTQPVPVVVPLSSWAQHRGTLDAWLVEQLFRLYSVDRKLGRRWVALRRVLPLLDGLDEVPAAHREACVAAINDYRYRRGSVHPIVITCRTDVYRALRTPPRLRRVVEVRRLSVDDVRRYLRAGGPALSGVREAIEHDPELAELITTPLLLAMISYAYRGRPPSSIPAPPDPAARRRTFFRDYVIRRLRNEFPAKPDLAPPVARNTEQQALRWLGWLARTMRDRNQSVFHPDLMQPDLLPGRAARWLLPPLFAGAVGIVAALVFGVLAGLSFDAITPPGRAGVGVSAGLLEGIIAGLACAAQCRRREIEPTRPPRLSAAALARVLLPGAGWAAVGALAGAVVGSWFGTMGAEALGTPVALVAVGVCGWLLGGAAGGATLGALTGLALGTVSALRPAPNVRPNRPGAGMRETRRIATVAGGVTMAVGTVAYGLHFGAALGVVVALRAGGADYLRHHVLRALLVRGGAIPRHLLTFLHDAHTSVLLTEVGGGYTFTHPLLRDHLADCAPGVSPRA